MFAPPIPRHVADNIWVSVFVLDLSKKLIGNYWFDFRTQKYARLVTWKSYMSVALPPFGSIDELQARLP